MSIELDPSKPIKYKNRVFKIDTFINEHGEEKLSLDHASDAAFSFIATDQDTSQKSFLKLSRTVTDPDLVPWFYEYIEYQKKMASRLDSSDAKDASLPMVDIFYVNYPDYGEGDPRNIKHLFQIYDFLENSFNLREILDTSFKDGGALASWKKRLDIGRVICHSIDLLQSQKIVHGDLKPENILLSENSSVNSGYVTNLIDMDRSIMLDVHPPWIDDESYHEGHAYTPTYQSPEHFQGKTPTFNSDIFTIGLILYELLTGVHPYQIRNEAEYREVVEKNIPPLPKLLRQHPDSIEAHERLVQVLQSCLALSEEDRPAIKDLKKALVYKVRLDPVAKPIKKTTELLITSSSNQSTNTYKRSYIFGRSTAKSDFNLADYRLYSTPQFRLAIEGSHWFIKPALGAINPTCLNGNPLLEAQEVDTGDKISVGNGTNLEIELKKS